jgi:sodium transport system permease protein
MNRTWVILLKELMDGLRDKRSLASAMIFPLLAPLLSAGLLSMIVSQDSNDRGPDGQDPELSIVGMDLAPTFVQHLDDHGFTPVAWQGQGAPEDAVTGGDHKVIVRIDADYASDFTEGRPARVEMLFDESRNDARSRIRKVRRAIQAYGGQVGALRLLARGVSPTLTQAVLLAEIDLSTPEERGAQLLQLIPMFIIMACFICSMYVAIDATAGERERGSLESLVLTPASPTELALAKWGATLVFGAVGVIATAALSVWACRFVDLDSLGMSLAAGPREIGMFLLICLPLTGVAAALQLLVATFSRSFKEAQTYLSLMIFLPMAPGFILTVKPMEEAAWMMAVPALGQQLMMGHVLQGDGLPGLDFVLSSLSCAVLTAACVLACGQLLRREQIIFGR